MRTGQRFGLSALEKGDVWSRWKAGQSLHEIGRAFDKPHSCIRSVLLPRGGIPPAARRRSRLALTLAEREDLSRGIASVLSMREMARRLDRAASTVSREVARHGGLRCRSTSAIRKVPGSAAPTKTPICCCGNTFREEPICPPTRKSSSTKSRCS
jgi:Helix-turn-helix domain